MTGNDAEVWYELRDGQPFCTKCNRALIGLTMKEAGVLDAPVEGAHWHCESCGRIDTVEVRSSSLLVPTISFNGLPSLTSLREAPYGSISGGITTLLILQACH